MDPLERRERQAGSGIPCRLEGEGSLKTAAKITGDQYGERSRINLAMPASLFRESLNKSDVGEAAPVADHRRSGGILLATEESVNPVHFILLALFAPSLAPAQETPTRYFEPHRAAADTPVASTGSPGRLSVQADPKVERLMERFTSMKHAQPGFRVQVFLGERKLAEDAKRAFLLKNPESPAYLSWFAPNWRLRVGDCRTRLEAERLLRDLKPLYPGSYIVPDEIEMPR
jgi:hypothetical protein